MTPNDNKKCTNIQTAIYREIGVRQRSGCCSKLFLHTMHRGG
jgi:hypothetical protein